MFNLKYKINLSSLRLLRSGELPVIGSLFYVKHCYSQIKIVMSNTGRLKNLDQNERVEQSYKKIKNNMGT